MRLLLGIFTALITVMVAPSMAQDEGVNGHGFHIVAQDGDPRDLLVFSALDGSMLANSSAQHCLNSQANR